MATFFKRKILVNWKKSGIRVTMTVSFMLLSVHRVISAFVAFVHVYKFWMFTRECAWKYILTMSMNFDIYIGRECVYVLLKCVVCEFSVWDYMFKLYIVCEYIDYKVSLYIYLSCSFCTDVVARRVLLACVLNCPCLIPPRIFI